MKNPFLTLRRTHARPWPHRSPRQRYGPVAACFHLTSSRWMSKPDRLCSRPRPPVSRDDAKSCTAAFSRPRRAESLTATGCLCCPCGYNHCGAFVVRLSCFDSQHRGVLRVRPRGALAVFLHRTHRSDSSSLRSATDFELAGRHRPRSHRFGLARPHLWPIRLPSCTPGLAPSVFIDTIANSAFA